MTRPPTAELGHPPSRKGLPAISRLGRWGALGICIAGLVAGGCQTSARSLQPSPSSTTSQSAARPPVRLIQTPTGVIVPVVRPVGSGWEVRTPCGRAVTVARGTPIRGVDVILDPGHGGIETGAVANGLKESDLNLDVARRVQDDLAAIGIRAALTRTADYRVPIATRAAIVNTVRPKLFVSINHNGGPAAHHAGPGTEVYYQHASSSAKRLAGLVWQDVYAALNQFNAHWVGASDAGAIYRLGRDGSDFYGVLRLAGRTPGVLLEAAYVTERSEAALLRTARFRSAEAKAVAAAIGRFLRTSDPGGGYHTPIDRGFGDPGGGGGLNGCEDPNLG